MESSDSPSFKVGIIGASGAIGRELIKLLVAYDKCSKITVIARRSLDEWKTEEFKSKLEVVECEDLDKLSEYKDKFAGHDVFYCCLGSRVGRGKDVFIKVDYQYPLDFANIAKENGIETYYLVSSSGSKASSWNLYLKTKGRVEADIKEIGLEHLVILKPGLLLERDNDKRFLETVSSWIPFMPKIKCSDVAKAMISHAYELIKDTEPKDPIVLSNSDLRKLAADATL